MSLLNNSKVPERLNFISNHIYALSIYKAMDNKLVAIQNNKDQICARGEFCQYLNEKSWTKVLKCFKFRKTDHISQNGSEVITCNASDVSTIFKIL